MIIGVDLGNYGVKTSENIHFLSKVIESNGFYEENEVIFDGKRLVVGEGEFQTDYNKSRKENTLALLYSALALSSKTEQYFQVVLGLPIQQYKSNKKEVIEYIEQNRCKEVILNGTKRDIFITDIQVAPEGASAYYNLTKATKEKIGKKQLVIVDIGGRTTDVCLFKDKQIKSYKTIGIGMLNVYNDIVTTVNELYTQNFNLEDGEEILTDFLKSWKKREKETILKVSHHGSANGTGTNFLQRIKPDAALISCGRKNPYGHPSKEVLERLQEQ